VELSTVLETEINLPFITADASGPQHMVKTLSRAKLDQLVSGLVDRTEGPCRQAITDSGLNAGAIDEVIMVGGMSRMPAVQEKVKQVFGKEPNRNVNPDEAVAMGAAIQAGVLAGEVDDIVLLDVTPLTLGLETLGSVMTTLISRNTTIPTKKNETFTTAAENQTTVDIHVLQGERSMASDNKSIGRFMLDGLLPAPRGIPQIEVTFDIDANGILSVSAQDKGTGKEQKIVIQSGSGLEKEDIERMVDEAAQNEEADQVRRAEVETRNQADSLVYSTEKLLVDNADKVSEELKSEVQGRIDALKAAIAANNTAEMQTATTELNGVMQRLGEAVYSQAAQPEGGDDAGTDSPGEGGDGGDEEGPSDDGEGTVEGEFREV
jgi:molecular chaperone DnaK